MNFSLQKIGLSLKHFTTSARNHLRLVQFVDKGKPSVGLEIEENSVINLSKSHNAIPNNMVGFLNGGNKLMEIAREVSVKKKDVISKTQVEFLPPLTGCEKIICIGMNYADHCAEVDIPIPEEPVIFSKFPSTIIGDGDNIVLPQYSDSVDWEVELAVVIGKQGKHIEEENALDYVAGYTVAHDVSARDWFGTRNGQQWLLGKTFDTFCPIGPVLVTKDSIKDPGNLNLKCLVNGEVVQSSNTNQLVFNIQSCIAWVSRIFTLKPGDILLTGTPPGVGVFRKPPVFLKSGDVVMCEIEGIGRITNPVVDEE